MTYRVLLSRVASKHREELIRQGYGDKVESIFRIISENPFPPNSKALKGQAKGLYSIRVNLQDRIVFEIEPYDGDEEISVPYKGKPRPDDIRKGIYRINDAFANYNILLKKYGYSMKKIGFTKWKNTNN